METLTVEEIIGGVQNEDYAEHHVVLLQLLSNLVGESSEEAMVLSVFQFVLCHLQQIYCQPHQEEKTDLLLVILSNLTVSETNSALLMKLISSDHNDFMHQLLEHFFHVDTMNEELNASTTSTIASVVSEIVPIPSSEATESSPVEPEQAISEIVVTKSKEEEEAAAAILAAQVAEAEALLFLLDVNDPLQKLSLLLLNLTRLEAGREMLLKQSSGLMPRIIAQVLTVDGNPIQYFSTVSFNTNN